MGEEMTTTTTRRIKTTTGSAPPDPPGPAALHRSMMSHISTIRPSIADKSEGYIYIYKTNFA